MENKHLSPHKNLKAWKSAMNLVQKVYLLTDTFPNTERYGLVAQMRRAAISIPSNIAEGANTATKKHFAHFLTLALGSLSELDTQLELSKLLNFAPDQNCFDINECMETTKKLVYGLRKSLLEQ